jgi:hypothetical protein
LLRSVVCGNRIVSEAYFFNRDYYSSDHSADVSRLSGRRVEASQAIGLVLALMIPFVAQSTVRAFTVRDFNIVSFGGFAMAGAAGLMIEPKHLPLYPEHIRPTANKILNGRAEAEHDGRVYATPLNSKNELSFLSAAVGYFDVYARTIDHLTWGVIAGVRDGNESWVQFNKRMQEFSIATVKIVPDRWAAWIVGGSSRFVGRAFVTNAPFVIFGVAFLAVGTVRIFSRGQPKAAVSRKDWLVVVIVAAGWAIMAIGLAIVVAFPSTRYIDTADMFFPAVPLLALIWASGVARRE